MCPTQICLEPSCPNIATSRGRCQQHARTRNRETRSRNAKIYNTARWQNTRKHYLFNHPICEHPDCPQIATDVHHRTDIQAGGDPWNEANLEALCHRHHSQITRREQVNNQSHLD